MGRAGRSRSRACSAHHSPPSPIPAPSSFQNTIAEWAYDRHFHSLEIPGAKSLSPQLAMCPKYWAHEIPLPVKFGKHLRSDPVAWMSRWTESWWAGDSLGGRHMSYKDKDESRQAPGDYPPPSWLVAGVQVPAESRDLEGHWCLHTSGNLTEFYSSEVRNKTGCLSLGFSGTARSCSYMGKACNITDPE